MKSIFPSLSDYRKYRILEIIPGVFTWGTFVLAIVLSFVAPLWAIYYIIVFDLYWLTRILYLVLFMVVSFMRYRKTVRVDWLPKVQSLPSWQEYTHLIFFPTYKEPLEVLRGTFTALTKVHYPLNKFIVVLAGEEKDQEHFESVAQSIQAEFGQKFFRLMVTVHPKDIPGEIAGKGANINWAGHEAQKFIDELHLSYDKVIVSAFDADTCAHPQYFAYLTYVYMNHPRPTRASYQPMAMFNNNVWESPPITRVISYSTTFWLMTEQSRPEHMLTFASHSMSFKALVDVGFWQTDVVSDDSRISLQCLMEYDGDYEVVPLYLPVSMDVVLGKTFWRTLKSQYIQQRRWGYGVENFPYVVWNFLRNKKMPAMKRFRYFFNQIEGVYSWATSAILIAIMGRLPLWVLAHKTETSVIAQTAPNILQWLMILGTIGLVIQAILGTTLLPPKPKNTSTWRLFIMIAQWALLPLTLIFFGSIPATEAQTRLMLGKYLGFNVTEKVRK
jgi:cellulose synthase/poly-beta-1,6-N-acetylglucosamine synthase-like glycosyltransferase